jgi:glycosyltransferase involved in cell wall biosynthesis
VLDAYDAWDRSPLVRGRHRRQAVVDGYRAAARDADLVFTNTPAMLERLRELGATSVQLLPNASPPVDAGGGPRGGERRGLVYVGRIHERFDTELTLAVAAAVPDTQITIAGPVEREPVGWSALVSRQNVSLVGQIDPLTARRMIATSAALIVPHRVDPYTRSQDAMKAWDAIATGTPVISTAIPPADTWPAGLAEICADGDAFVAAARRAVAGALEPNRERRLQFARDNQWSARARTAIEALEDLGRGRGGRRQ